MNDYSLKKIDAKIHQYNKRKSNAISFKISDINILSKGSLSKSTNRNFQLQVIEALNSFNKEHFECPIFLEILITTTLKNPPHIQNIVKSLLDLLSKPIEDIKTEKEFLLYKDDSLIQALFVTCNHRGESKKKPSIYIKAKPFSDFIKDIGLLVDLEIKYGDLHIYENDSDVLEYVLEHKQNSHSIHNKNFLNLIHQQRQDSILQRQKITPSNIYYMYKKNNLFNFNWTDFWNEHTPLQIKLSSPPQKKNSANLWKEEIRTKMTDFVSKFKEIITPLKVPTSIEVFVKPPSKAKNTNDLDNILRTYIIPELIKTIKPISNVAFTMDSEKLSSFNIPIPPKSTKIGVSSYTIWRLPPTKNSDGFVNIAITSDLYKTNIFSQVSHNGIDEYIEKHKDSKYFTIDK